MKNQKIFWPHPPRRLRRLDPRACGARTSAPAAPRPWPPRSEILDPPLTAPHRKLAYLPRERCALRSFRRPSVRSWEICFCNLLLIFLRKQRKLSNCQRIKCYVHHTDCQKRRGEKQLAGTTRGQAPHALLTKLWCNRIELKRCSVCDNCRKRKHNTSRSSQVAALILRPKS